MKSDLKSIIRDKLNKKYSALYLVFFTYTLAGREIIAIL